MIRILFVMIFAAVIVHWAKSWRRIVGVTLIATLAAGILFPPPAQAQFGLLGGIRNILDAINGAIRSGLNSISAISRSVETFNQQIVWPVQLVNQAKSTIGSLIARFRSVQHSIQSVPVNSANLPIPAALEAIIRNGQTNDFPNLTQSYYRTFGQLPPVDEADALARNMMDIDDGMALNSLKTVKTSDKLGDLMLDSAARFEDEVQASAPGSAAFLTAAAIAANVQSQAVMQRMLASMLRQEGARIAHENTGRKRQGLLAAKVREGISDVLQRP